MNLEAEAVFCERYSVSRCLTVYVNRREANRATAARRAKQLLAFDYPNESITQTNRTFHTKTDWGFEFEVRPNA